MFPGHVPGSIQIGLGGQFAAWAGSVIGLDRDIILVAEDGQEEEARKRLARVGIDGWQESEDGIARLGVSRSAAGQTRQMRVQD